jgi:glycosyltransferase involved in cell wall biosynthesis
MPETNQPKGIHILLIHQAFAALDEPGGTRHYEMARHFVRNGHRVTVICSPVSYLTGKSSAARPRWLIRETPEAGLTILRVYTYAALHRSFFHRVLSFFSFMFSSFFVGLGVKNVHVIWGTSPPIFQGWTGWLLARLKRVRFLFEIRDLWPAFAIAMNVLKNPILINLSTWLEGFLYRHADRLVVNSPGFIDFITKRGGKEIALIPNGVDPEMFTTGDDGSKFRHEHGLQEDFILLYAGAHGASNDLEVVLSAAQLTLENRKIKYIFVGDGKEKGTLQSLAEDWKLDNVRFLPPVPKLEMNAILAAANACIAILKPLELYKTTYPNKVFDYMAAGKPVVCVIDGVIRQVVETAGAGLFSPPGDPQALALTVQKLASDPESCIQMGRNGRECVVKSFDRKRISLDMEKLLMDLVR